MIFWSVVNKYGRIENCRFPHGFVNEDCGCKREKLDLTSWAEYRFFAVFLFCWLLPVASMDYQIVGERL